MQTNASFSASRHGRPRPSNIFPGSRTASDERPWPSPSFNSSMSLTNVEDVFVDKSRASAMSRRSSAGLPPTPVTASILPSPRSNGERLPSLSDLFVNDDGILAPLTPISTPQVEGMYMSPSSRGSSSAQEGRHSSSPTGWNGGWSQSRETYSVNRRSSEIVFSRSQMPTSDSVVGLGIDLESTPKALSRTDKKRCIRDSHPLSSPPISHPGAPRLGVIEKGVFEDFRAGPGGTSPEKRRELGFGWTKFVAPREARLESRFGPTSVAMEREAAVRLEEGMPRAGNLYGLGIDLNPSVSANEQASMVVEANKVATSRDMRPSSSGSTGHTGLTPSFRTNRISGVDTPTRVSTQRSPNKDKARKASPRSPTEATKGKRPGQLNFRAQYSAPSKEERANASREISQTPIKSKPMFRLDNGSSSKKAAGKGRRSKTSDAQWGVFGIKEDWKPLHSPASCKAVGLGNRNRLNEEESAMARVASPGKRGSQGAGMDLSPSKRHRIGYEGAPGSFGQMKENVMEVGSGGGGLKRSKAGTGSSASPRKTVVGLR